MKLLELEDSDRVCLRADVPTVILVCMLSLSTSTLLRMTASRATTMYVRLMSNTIDVPGTHTRQL